MSTISIINAVKAAHAAITEARDDIEQLDRAIGDGDHYYNLKRGAETILAMQSELETMPPEAALKGIAMKLMSTIGGASGPLIASFFLGMAKTPGVEQRWNVETVAKMVDAGVDAICKRGKAGLGDKTMLDVLIPVAGTLSAAAAEGWDDHQLREALKRTAETGMTSTRDMLARKGRAAFLGERAVGHVDPGAMSSKVIVQAICDTSSGAA